MPWKQKLAELFVSITAKLDPLRGAMKKARAILKRGSDAMVRMAKRAALAIGVGLVAAMVWAAKKALIQEDAELDLAAALETTGDATKENIDALKKYAAELQKLTKFGDEEILAQMAYAKNLGVSTDQLKEAAKAAIGLAAKYKLNLATAMMLVGRASQGQTQMLTRYGIVLDESLTAQEKFNAVLKIGAGAFRLAEAAARTTGGRIIQIWNRIGDIAEKVAEPLLVKLREIVNNMDSWVDANQEFLDQKLPGYVGKLADGLIIVAKNIPLITRGVLALTGVWIASKAIAVATAVGSLAIWVKLGARIKWFTKLTGGLFRVVRETMRQAAMLPTAMAGRFLTNMGKALAGIGLHFVQWLATIAGIAVGLYVIADRLVRITATYIKLRAVRKDILKQDEKFAKIQKQLADEKASGQTAKDIAAFKKRAAIARQEAADAARAAKNAVVAAAKASRDAANEERLALVVLADEKAEQATRDYRDKLRTLEDLYTDAKGYERLLANVKSRLRHEEAVDIAKKMKGGYNEAIRILDAKAAAADLANAGGDDAVERARAGLVGFEAAWGAIATGTQRVEQEQLKVQKESKDLLKEIAEQGRSGKDTRTGYAK